MAMVTFRNMYNRQATAPSPVPPRAGGIVISPAQCRGARGLLSISQQDLAELAGVSLALINHFESGRRRPGLIRLHAIREALLARGVDFLDQAESGPGVRLRERERLSFAR